MTLTLHNLTASSGTAAKRKRVGRGNGSGHGTYATRGLKGQKARSGVTNLKRLGLKKMLLSTPKLRGFKSLRPGSQAVSLAAISLKFSNGAKIDRAALKRAGLITHIEQRVKILNQGELTLDQLTFVGVKASAAAAEKITARGGQLLERW